MDFAKICRVCLGNYELNYNIYTDAYGNVLYSEMLSTSTKIKPYSDDGLPRHICKECCKQLKKTFLFNIQCNESDKKLKSYLEKIKAEIEEKNEIVTTAEVKKELNVNDIIHKNISSLVEENLKQDGDVKLEPNCADLENDDGWDAEDDNLLLEVIKSQKIDDEVEDQEISNKKRRSRKKKEFVDRKLKPDSKLPHQCDICGKFLSTKSNLKAHKICHTDLRPYQCIHCPASFKGHSALFQHLKVHTGETPYHCEYCSKQFSRRTGLVNHIKIHMGEKCFSCEICSKMFVQSAQLAIHLKRHKGEKSFLCQDCGKGFPVKAELKVHQRTHNGEKPYSCHLCSKTFATSGNLSIHIRIHNKEIRYNCGECHRGFVTCSSYNVHLKRHKGQRDYHCECGKTFYTSSALKQHKVVHTGEKKYQCKICDRKFTQTSHLSRHFKRDHAKPNVPLPASNDYRVVLKAPFEEHPANQKPQGPTPDNSVKCESQVVGVSQAGQFRS